MQRLALGLVKPARHRRLFHSTSCAMGYQPHRRWWMRGYESLTWKEKAELKQLDADHEARALAEKFKPGNLDLPIGVVLSEDEIPGLEKYLDEYLKDAIKDDDEVDKQYNKLMTWYQGQTPEDIERFNQRLEAKEEAKRKLKRKKVKVDLLFGPQPHQKKAMPSKRFDLPAYKYRF